MPDLVGHYLHVGALHNEAYFGSSLKLAERILFTPVQIYHTVLRATRRKLPFEEPQKRRLAASGRAAHTQHLAFLKREADVLKRLLTV